MVLFLCNQLRAAVLVKNWIEISKPLFNFILAKTSFKFHLSLFAIQKNISRRYQLKKLAPIILLETNSKRTYYISTTTT